MDKCIHSIGKAASFPTLHLKNGSWQVEVKETDQEKAVFISHNDLYHSVQMRFDLVNDMGTFQHAVNVVRSPVEWQRALVYLDDIVIFSRSQCDHVQHVERVLSL